MPELRCAPVKRLMQQHSPYQLSTDAVVYLRGILELLASRITKLAVREQENFNEHRTSQGLPPRLRLDDRAISQAIKKLNSDSGIIFSGLQAGSLGSLGGKDMEIEDEATKSASSDGIAVGGA